MVSNKITQLIVSFLIFLFLYTGVSKLIDRQTFRMALDRQPFPKSMSDLLVWLLPLGELFVVILLLFEITRKVGLWLSAALLLSFTLYTIIVLSGYYPTTPCPCGGLISGLSWKAHLMLNLACLLLNVAGIVFYKDQKQCNELRNQEKPNTCRI